jgi:hypothetical protein
MHKGPPQPWACECGGLFEKVWRPVHIITTGCSQDVNEIPPQFAVTNNPLKGTTKAKALKMERAYARNLHNQRRAAREGLGQGKTIGKTHSYPAHLWHGKIRQTGDKHYWEDPKNAARHDSVSRIT